MQIYRAKRLKWLKVTKNSLLTGYAIPTTKAENINSSRYFIIMYEKVVLKLCAVHSK
jgi:hypothetical protein